MAGKTPVRKPVSPASPGPTPPAERPTAPSTPRKHPDAPREPVRKTDTAKGKRPTRRTTGIKPQGGPPTDYSPRMAKILQNLALGNYLKASAMAAGVPLSTVNFWRQEGEIEIERMRLHTEDVELRIMEWADSHDLTLYVGSLWTEPMPEWATSKAPHIWHRSVFAVLLQHARGRSEASLVKNIKSAAANDWKAAAFILARTNPADWAEQKTITQQGPGGGPIQIQAVPSSDQLTEKLSELLAQRQRELEQ